MEEEMEGKSFELPDDITTLGEWPFGRGRE